MAELISQSEFARRLGVAKSSVQKALRAGDRIRTVDGLPSGKIDWETQSGLWFKNRDAAKDRSHNDPGRKRDNTPGAPPGRNGSQSDEKQNGNNSLNSARTAKELYTAQLKRVEYEEAVGNLVYKQYVQNAMVGWARSVRNLILQIPNRLSARFATAMIQLIIPVIQKHASKQASEKIISEISSMQNKFIRIAKDEWMKEARAALEQLDNRPSLRKRN
jgi:phage terminase Nu1 subunit (DNA packaging protein)